MKSKEDKLKLAVYWGAGCGGCCVSVLDVHEKLIDISEKVDFVFWPIALDTKYNEVEIMPDGYIDITLYNGAVRNSENEEMAKLLRQKSKILIAYGSCSHLGGIPGLANLHSKEEIFNRIYKTSESTDNSDYTTPLIKYKVKEGELELPEFYNDVKTLSQTVDVDFFIPGCPPQTDRLVDVLTAVFNKEELPPNGSVIGAGEKTQCEECPRIRNEDKKITGFKRTLEIVDDGETCFLEQGIICMGPATRIGCNYRCIEGNNPCRGCYGPPKNAVDPGARMMSSIATIIDSNDPEEINRIVDELDDTIGTFYRYSLPGSILRRRIMNKKEEEIIKDQTT
jgi:F420-non-reducing hydrogenase small subunit